MADEKFPGWNNDDQPGSINELYQWVISKTQKQIDWYENKRKPMKYLAQRMRGGALVSATLGGLCPLLAPLMDPRGHILPTLGYVFIGLGAALITFDKFYGFSSAWMRFADAQLSLTTLLRELQFDWILLRAQPFSVETAIQKLKEFTSRVDSIVKQETEVWLVNLKNTIDQLEKRLKDENEKRKAGGAS